MADTPDFRFAAPGEIGAIARLVSHSFPGPARPLSWLEEQLERPVWGGGADTLFVGVAGERFIAACQLHPLRQWVGGVPLATAGVGGVSIAPTHRRRGAAAALMTAALRAARERGDVASSLYPFRVSFYGRLGYGQAGEALQWLVPPEMLPDSPERERIELLDTAALRAEALAFYGGWIRTQNGQLERNERVWAQIAGAHDTALVGHRGGDGSLDGYAFVVYRTDLPPERRWLEVEELVWATAEARRGLSAWLASLGDQWPRLLVRSLPSHRLGDWIREPRLPHGSAPLWRLWAPAATLLHGPMFRLLDVRAAWAVRRVAEETEPLRVTFDIADAQIPANAGPLHLDIADGRAKPGPGGAASELTVRLDVSTLSRLYIGALSASAGLEVGLLDCDRPDRLARLDAALALPEPWTFDRF